MSSLSPTEIVALTKGLGEVLKTCYYESLQLIRAFLFGVYPNEQVWRMGSSVVLKVNIQRHQESKGVVSIDINMHVHPLYRQIEGRVFVFNQKVIFG